jgi:hypothetical protein
MRCPAGACRARCLTTACSGRRCTPSADAERSVASTRSSRMEMRRLSLLLIVFSSLVCTACSYITDFVIINASESPVEVTYKIKEPPNGPKNISVIPSIKLASQLKSDDKNKWNDLAVDRYRSDQASRTVIVKLLSQEALFLTSMHHYTGPDDPHDVECFPIEELSIIGSVGNLKSSGKQLLRAFTEQSRVLYTLTYQ